MTHKQEKYISKIHGLSELWAFKSWFRKTKAGLYRRTIYYTIYTSIKRKFTMWSNSPVFSQHSLMPGALGNDIEQYQNCE